MSTEKTWEQFYKNNDGIYSSGHFSDRKDIDGQIYNNYQIAYREELLKYSGKELAVELGCGNKPIFEVLGHFDSVYYTDISKEALVQAKKAFEALDTSKLITDSVYFEEMNVDSFLLFDNDSLDLVFNTRAPHRDETSKELYRTLKDDGVYVYQTIGEEDFKDFKLLLQDGRFYDDYLKLGKTRFQVVKESLIQASFNQDNIELIFDDRYKNYFDSKEEFKEKLWLLVGDFNFDSPELDKVIDEYIDSHTNEEGKIWVENHRIVIKAVK